MNEESLREIAKKLVASPKGILAADWSTGTITKKFAAVGLTSTPELNRVYRQMLVSTPQIEEFISGTIFIEETAKQKTDSGALFPDYVSQKGIIPGIRADKGNGPFGSGEEEITLGLEDLPTRLDGYLRMNLRFTKWRAAVKISDIYPSSEFLQENIGRMVKFAAISQEKGFVPIVEPEVVMNGNHTTARCEEITKETLALLFVKLKERGIDLTRLILKPNMVLPGKDSGVKAAPLEIAQATLRAVRATVPHEVPGIVFLSGGQTPQEATVNLNEINRLKEDTPWQLSFSYARALQSEPLNAWRGEERNVKTAQHMLYKRARLVSLARQGKYSPEMENE